MRRAVVLTALLIGALAVVPAANAVKVGVSDQQAKTFIDKNYAPLNLTIARYITPWDVLTNPDQLAKLQAWVLAARFAHQRILVSFEHSRTPGQEQKTPSVKKYTKALRAFKAAFPIVKEISPWNEVNRCQTGGRTEGQPQGICNLRKNGPKRAAQYYMAARKVFRGKKIVALDILDQNNVKPAVAYVKAFRKYAKPAPKIWGFHNYSDTNRGSGKRTKALLKATGKGEVWLTETGGIVRFGGGFPYNENRAAKALGCMFSLAKSNKRITRVYIYQYNGAAPDASFDAGLIGTDDSTRPGYEVVKQRRAKRC